MNTKLLIILTLIAVCVRKNCRAANGKRRYRTHTRLISNQYDEIYCKDFPSNSNPSLRIIAMSSVTSNAILVKFSNGKDVYVAKPDTVSRYPFVVKQYIPPKFTHLDTGSKIFIFPVSSHKTGDKWNVRQVIAKSNKSSREFFFYETGATFPISKYPFLNESKDITAIFELQPRRRDPRVFYYIVFKTGKNLPQTWKYDTSKEASVLMDEFKLTFGQKNNEVVFDSIALFNSYDTRSRELVGIQTVYNASLFQFFKIRIQNDMILKISEPLLDSQVLFGCPKTLCIYADIDGTSYNNNQMIIVSESFIWEFTLGYYQNKNFGVRHAKSLNQMFETIGDVVGKIENTIDAIFINDSKTVFLMGDSIWVEKDKNQDKVELVKHDIDNYFNNLLPKNLEIDATTNIMIDEEDALYLFSGSTYYVYIIDEQKFITHNDIIAYPLSDFGFPKELDAVFTEKNKVYALKANYIYEVEINKDSPKPCYGTAKNCRVYPSEKPTIELFQEHFKAYCEYYKYNETKFNSYNEYIFWWKERWNPELSPISEAEQIRKILIIAFLTIATVLVILVGVLMYYRNALYESLSGLTEIDRTPRKSRMFSALLTSTIASLQRHKKKKKTEKLKQAKRKK